MENIILGLKFAFSHYSIFPISFKKGDDLSKKEILALMISFFPLVGFVIGVVVVFFYAIFFSKFGVYGALICAILYMLFYGFIHTEAVIDVVDAIYAKLGGGSSFKVIKEPTVGAMGVLYAIALFLLKVSMVIYTLLNGYFREFISILIVSRLSILILIDTFDFKSSFVSAIKEGLSWRHIFFSILLYSTLGSLINPYFIILFPLGIVLSFLISILFARLVGFINGDVLGATLEVVEFLMLFIILIISY